MERESIQPGEIRISLFDIAKQVGFKLLRAGPILERENSSRNFQDE
jgi:hypothetical protein